MKKPVTLITGYLGSGKTTLMNELLRHQDTKGLALIVNDMGSVNVDAEILKKNNNKVSCDTKLIEMQNGCICCTLLVEFMDQIKKLRDTDAHATVILSETDTRTLKKLGIRLTTEPAYETDRLYRK